MNTKIDVTLNNFRALANQVSEMFANTPELRFYLNNIRLALVATENVERSGALTTATANNILNVVPHPDTLHGIEPEIIAKVQELWQMAQSIVKNPQGVFNQYRENLQFQTTKQALVESVRANNAVNAIKMLGLHCGSKTLQIQNIFDPLKPVISVPEHELKNILSKVRQGFRFGDFEVVKAYQLSKPVEGAEQNQKGVAVKVASDYHPDEIVDVQVLQGL